MNLFRNRNKLEEKLRNQFNDLEYRPSDSSWERIEKQIPGVFEKGMQSGLKGFEVQPGNHVWENVEFELPAERKPTTSYRYLLVAALFLFSSLMAILYVNRSTVNETLVTENREDVGGINHGGTVERRNSEEINRKDPLAQQGNAEVRETDANALRENINRRDAKVESNLENPEVEKIVAINKEKSNRRDAKAQGNIETKEVDAAALNKEKLIRKGTEAQRSSEANVSLVSKEKLNHGGTETQKSAKNSAGKAKQKSAVAAGLVLQNNPPPAKTTTNQTNEPGKNKAVPAVTDNPSMIAAAVPAKDSVVTVAAGEEQPSIMKKEPGVTVAASESSGIADKSGEEELTRYSITIQAGVNSCMSLLKEPSSGNINFKKNIALRSSIEMPEADWSGLFMVDYNVNDKLRISMGIGMLNFSQQFYYNTAVPSTPPANNETPATIINPNDSIVQGDGNNNRIKYSWTEIPLFVTYRLPSRSKWHIELQSGVSWGILSTVDAGMINYNNVGILVCKDKAAFPGFKNSVFFTFNPGVTYQFNKLVSLSLMPGVKISMNSMTENENWVQQRPYFVGVSAALRRRF